MGGYLEGGRWGLGEGAASSPPRRSGLQVPGLADSHLLGADCSARVRDMSRSRGTLET